MTLKLKQLRESKGVTQTFIAKKLGYKNPVSYHRIEKGDARLTLQQAKVIADVLNCKVDDFF